MSCSPARFQWSLLTCTHHPAPVFVFAAFALPFPSLPSWPSHHFPLVPFSPFFCCSHRFLIDGRDVFTQEHHVVTFFHTKLWRREAVVERQEGTHMQLPSYSPSSFLAPDDVTRRLHASRVPLPSEVSPSEALPRAFSLWSVDSLHSPSSLSSSELPNTPLAVAALFHVAPSSNSSPPSVQASALPAPNPSLLASAAPSALSAESSSSSAGTLKTVDLERGAKPCAEATKGEETDRHCETQGGEDTRPNRKTGRTEEERRSTESEARNGTDEAATAAKNTVESLHRKADLHGRGSPERDAPQQRVTAEWLDRTRDPAGGGEDGYENEEEARPGKEGKALPVLATENPMEPLRKGGKDREPPGFGDRENENQRKRRNQRPHVGREENPQLPVALEDETQEHFTAQGGQGREKDEDAAALDANIHGREKTDAHGERLDNRGTREDRSSDDAERQTRTHGEELAGGSARSHAAAKTGKPPALESPRLPRLSSSHKSPLRPASSSSVVASSFVFARPSRLSPRFSSPSVFSRSYLPFVEGEAGAQTPSGERERNADGTEPPFLESSKEETRHTAALFSPSKEGPRKEKTSTVTRGLLDWRARFGDNASGHYNETEDAGSGSTSSSSGLPSLSPFLSSSSSTPETQTREEKQVPRSTDFPSSSHSQPDLKKRPEVQEQNVNLLMASYNACRTFTCGDGR
ncbi:conserved hypothetical protein [Neospora caninum Liverpool]|uniref:Uncharacterized protein n=1 Tax=Neospora caninum (strain Liverpool) TaxID=572307 RepID=F0V7M1_NEOCL|nr:conserved hypothetical protein [Neospora caninum Liverpool]CBZ49712.1 conserved hypothetical protein [Neospora caninum Liverpool]CEL64297.1 TPA: hypothetical protein BN1204_002000 [Neospora caninum Liverpool]|eukprot:XP_003879747.1 conserved hypothetical protein [Neospora caninum Liverpool]